MPKTKNNDSNLDPKVYRRLPGTDSVACLVCPSRTDGHCTMHKKHIQKHDETMKHQHHVKSKQNSYVPIPNLSLSGPSYQHGPISDHDLGFDLDGMWVAESHQISEDLPMDHPEPLSFGDLLGPTFGDRMYTIGDGTHDYFQEAVDSLQNGEYQFSFSSLTGEELGLETEEGGFGGEADGVDAFGIDIPDECPVGSSKRIKNGPVKPDSPTYPWPSMAMFLTDLLFASPRLRFSEAQKSAILKWGKDLRAPDVPTLSGLKSVRQRIEGLVGDVTEKVTSAAGNIFYLNDVGKAIAKDYANPITRYAMQDYPEDGGSGMKQVFNGAKMLLDIPSEIVSPTVRIHGRIFFVDELLQCSSGAYFIPERFFNAKSVASGSTTEPFQDKELLALGHDVSLTEAGFIVDPERVIMPVSAFSRTYIDITTAEKPLPFVPSSQHFQAKMPHPFRERANGRMVYSVPLIIFMDDVSGNISKQWNKHHAIYMSNANLPREMLEKEFCVRFVTSSPHASPMELMRAMKESISKSAESGISAWDCKNDEEVLLRLYALFFAGDNPMQAEECSHGGLKCNYFCRTCNVGGNKEFKESEQGYESLFKPGVPRNPEETARQAREQLRLSTVSGGTDKVKNATASTGVKDSSTLGIINSLLELGKRLRKPEPGKEKMTEEQIRMTLEKQLEEELLKNDINPLIGMAGVDIHMDTPTEILHTILLGVVKYFWGQTVWLMDKAHTMDIFQTRLASIDANGLNMPSLNADYICRYKGSLIGKHFKSLAQVMPFLIHDLVPKSVLDGWCTIGSLVVLLWHTEIEDTEKYLAELSRVLEDFLTITAQCAPSILISKPKFHFLIHLAAYIRRFGPAIMFSTERYESFNHVFRLACIHSNRAAPSRDTCNTFATQDTIKHIATGGYWFDPGSKTWVHAGSAILDHVAADRKVLPFLGLNDIKTGNLERAGVAKLMPAIRKENARPQRHPPVPWTQTLCSTISEGGHRAEHAKFHKAVSFVAPNGDKVTDDTYVIFRAPQNGKHSVGQVKEVLVPADGPQLLATHIVIQHLEFLPSVHPTFLLPRLKLIEDKAVLCPGDVICSVNLQHDCVTSQCTHTQQTRQRQERSESAKLRTSIVHASAPNYILNAYSLHNYQHILSTIPSQLRITAPRIANPEEIRKQAVKQMRDKKTAAKAPAGTSILDGIGIDHSLPPASTPAFERNPLKRQTKKKKAETTKPKKNEAERVPTNSETSMQRPALPYPQLQYHLTPGYHFSQQSLPQPVGSPYSHPQYHSMPGYNHLQHSSSSHPATYHHGQPFSVWQSTPQQPGLQNHFPSSHYANIHSSSHHFYPPNSGPPP